MLKNRYKRTFPFEKRKEEAKRILENIQIEFRLYVSV